MTRSTLPAVMAALLACTACAAGTASSGTTTASGGAAAGTPSAPRARSGSSLITRDEVRASQGTNAFELVQFLRPAWMQQRGAVKLEGDGGIVVYLDDTRLGGLDALRQVEKNAIATIRYFDAAAAQARFGLNHTYGAIQVVSARS